MNHSFYKYSAGMIIVTGGSGFIGSNIVSSLMNNYNGEVVVCDYWGNDNKWQNIKKCLINKVIFPSQLSDFLEKNSTKIDTIFHMGAISSTTETNVAEIIKENLQFSQDIFDWCSENSVRFIYASSAATYGDGKNGFIDDDNLEYLSKLLPLNAYAWSKLLFDKYVSYRKYNNYKMPKQCVGLKFFNVYGPNEYHKGNQLSVVWQVYQKIILSQKVTLFKSANPTYKDGYQLRDFIYVKDCCKVINWMFKNPKINGLFNVGTGQARPFIDLASAVFKSVKKNVNVKYVDLPSNLQNTYQYYTQADLSNLRNSGYDKKFISLEDGIKDYVTSYLSQQDCYL